MKKSTNVKDLDEYLVCGRKASTRLVAFSILASCIGGSATIGMAGLAWQCGTPAFWWLGAGVIGLILLGFFVAPKMRAARARTLPEVILAYLGPHCAWLCALLILLSNIAIIAAQFSALGIMLASLTGLRQNTALLLCSLALLAYTFLGGQKAVMKSDIWQFLILLGSLLLAFTFLLQEPACLDALRQTPLEAINADFSFSRLCYYLIILGGSFVIGPMLSGRILSAKDGQAARNGALLAALALALVAALITAIGIALQGISLGNIAPQDALAAGIAKALPSWAGAAITIGLISAVVSSADSCLLTAASVGANDLTGKKLGRGILSIRVWLVLIAAGSALLALNGKSLIALLLVANDIYVAGVVAPVFVAILTGRQTGWRRASFLCAMFLGGSFGLVAAATGEPSCSLIGFGAAASLSCLTILPWRKAGKITASV